MKLCVPSTGRNIDAIVEMTFAKAAYFLIVDTEDLSMDVVENRSDTAESARSIKAAQRSIKAAQLILDKKVEGVITGYMGFQAFITLRNAGVRIYEGLSRKEIVKEAISNFKNNIYTQSSDPLMDYPITSGQCIEFACEKFCKTSSCCAN